MPRKHNFWRELPLELGLSTWANLAVCAVVNLVIATFLGAVIGGLFGLIMRVEGKEISLQTTCLGGILFFVPLGLLNKRSWYFLRFLYKYTFNKQQSKKGGQE